ncbi:hypothetical protein Tco_1234959 [Tanacetum coccineum]
MTPCRNTATEYYDRNYHQILPIIAEKVHLEKVQQEKLKAVKVVSILRKPHVILSQEHQSKEGVSRKGSDQDIFTADPEARRQGKECIRALRRLEALVKPQ